MAMSNVRYYRKDGTWGRKYRRKYPSRAGILTTAAACGAITVALVEHGHIGALKPDAPSPTRSASAVPAEVRAAVKRTRAVLVAAGYTADLTMRTGTGCAAHSYGRMREFFQSNPCQWLARAYLRVGYSEFLVAVSWVGMPDVASADHYRSLVDTPGSGNVTELSRETTLYRKITYAGGPHMSGTNGTAVWNVQVKPVFPRPEAEVRRILLDSRQ
jgi:hypothetical protein